MKKKPFKKGQKVEIIDKGDIYPQYSQIIKRHMKYAIHWAYKDTEPNTTDLYIVKGVYRHCEPDPYDKNNWCVVIENIRTHQIYLIGELGLKMIQNY